MLQVFKRKILLQFDAELLYFFIVFYRGQCFYDLVSVENGIKIKLFCTVCLS